MFIKERQSKLEEMRSQFTNLYVKNVDPEVTENEFVDLFAKYGTVTSAVIQMDDEGRSKGFGFVNFETHDQAQAAVEALHESEYEGRKLFVSRAQKKAEREDELRKTYEQAKQEKMGKYQGVNLYIKNLEDDIDDEKLRGEFEPFGTITSCKVMCDEKGTSKGFGFVCFSSPDEATKAVADMNNKIIGTKPLYVSLAQRREVRRQQLESQIAQRNQIRLQQAAAAGIPGGYINVNGPMYYPPNAGAYPPQGGRGILGYPPQPGMLVDLRPKVAYSDMMLGMPLHAPYGQAPPQGYGSIAGYPRGGAPRPPIPREGGPTGQPGIPRATGAPAASGAPVPRPGPQGSIAPPRGAPGVAPSAGRPPQGYKGNPPVTRNGPPPAQAVPAPAASTGTVPLDTALLSGASPMEQKQMLGEVIYMRIVP